MFKLASEAIRIPHPGDFRRHLKAGLKQLVNEQGIFDERTLAKWKMDNGPQALRRGNRAKFEQNYQLRQLLMHTGRQGALVLVVVFLQANVCSSSPRPTTVCSVSACPRRSF
jgi:hypothetical protein